MDQREKNDLIVSSLWVVNAVFEKLSINDEDLKSNATLYLYKLADRYDSSKGVKFSTYAYNSLYLYVRTRWAKQKHKDSNVIVSTTLLEIEPAKSYEDSVGNECMVEQIKSLCSERELKICELFLQGYKVVEIAKIVGIATPTAHHNIRELKEKVKAFYNNEGGKK